MENTSKYYVGRNQYFVEPLDHKMLQYSSSAQSVLHQAPTNPDGTAENIVSFAPQHDAFRPHVAAAVASANSGFTLSDDSGAEQHGSEGAGASGGDGDGGAARNSSNAESSQLSWRDPGNPFLNQQGGPQAQSFQLEAQQRIAAALTRQFTEEEKAVMQRQAEAAALGLDQTDLHNTSSVHSLPSPPSPPRERVHGRPLETPLSPRERQAVATHADRIRLAREKHYLDEHCLKIAHIL